MMLELIDYIQYSRNLHKLCFADLVERLLITTTAIRNSSVIPADRKFSMCIKVVIIIRHVKVFKLELISDLESQNTIKSYLDMLYDISYFNGIPNIQIIMKEISQLGLYSEIAWFQSKFKNYDLINDYF